jgi:tetratricopeptide (TPR) repeat protein
MNSTEEKIQQASSCFNAGKYAEAKALCTDILQAWPNNVEVLHLSGITSAQTRNFEEAVGLMARAIFLAPDNPLYYANLGNVFLASNQPGSALALFDKAIQLKPDSAQAYSNRGNALSAMGKLNEALASYARAVEIMPELAQAHYNCATVLVALQRFPEALESYEIAIACKPDFAEAYINRGIVLSKLDRQCDALASYTKAISIRPDSTMAYCNRGIVYRKMQHLAIADFQKAIALNPGNADAHFNLGLIWKEQGQPGQAIACFDAAITQSHVPAIIEKGITLQCLGMIDDAIESYGAALKLDERNVLAHYNLGVALAQSRQTEAAISSFEQALLLQPDYVDALVNCGNALLELHRSDAALACYDNAIQLKPDMVEAHWNKALALLMQGKWEKGWQSYEWRWKKAEFMESSLGAGIPLWDAQPTRNLFIWAEQGIGDEIMFGALLPQSLQLATRVKVQMDKRLVPLFRRSMPDIDIEAKHHLPDTSLFDARLPMGSLARIFCNSSQAFGAIQSPYLKADKIRSQNIRTLIGTAKPLICGLSWYSKNESTGQERTIALKTLINALDIKEVQFVSLQYGDVAQEVADVKNMLQTEVLQLDTIDNFNDLDGLAALIDACDLVISIDNSTAHLASALGKSTWLMVPFAANWRWMLEGNQSPWYPTLKIYRQEAAGDWETVLAQLRRDLGALSAGERKSASWQLAS